MDFFMFIVLLLSLVLSVATLYLYQSKCIALAEELEQCYRTQAELELLSAKRLDTIGALERRIEAYDRILHGSRDSIQRADDHVSTTITLGA